MPNPVQVQVDKLKTTLSKKKLKLRALNETMQDDDLSLQSLREINNLPHAASHILTNINNTKERIKKNRESISQLNQEIFQLEQKIFYTESLKKITTEIDDVKEIVARNLTETTNVNPIDEQLKKLKENIKEADEKLQHKESLQRAFDEALGSIALFKKESGGPKVIGYKTYRSILRLNWDITNSNFSCLRGPSIFGGFGGRKGTPQETGTRDTRTRDRRLSK